MRSGSSSTAPSVKNRREFIKSLTAGAIASAAAATGAGSLPGVRAADAVNAAHRPNILFIMADDHAAHAVSAYGSRINQTPNIDRIAREGMLLRNCFCTNALCAPSRAVLLTGKHSHLNGQRGNGSRFDGSQQTMPKLMQAAGYQTAVIGKWHLQSDPTGFDYWCVLPGQGSYFDPAMTENGEKKKFAGYVTDIITDLTIAYLDKRDTSKPFCLLCHHKAPHRNWQPDEKHKAMFKDRTIPEPETFNDDYANRSSAASASKNRVDRDLTKADVKETPPAGLSPEALKKWKYQRYMQDYLACVQAVDDNVGRLLKYLDDTGLAANTLVCYTSDQGFFLGDHNWFDKRFMFEESLRMPFVVRLPGVIAPGGVSASLAQNLDFAPTFLDCAGAPIPADMQGRSLLPVLRGATPADWRKSIYYHYYEYPGGHSVKRHYGVRTERYKLIHYYHDIDEWELFDLQRDPHELRNVYSEPEYAATVKELTAELDRLRAYYKDDAAADGMEERRPRKSRSAPQAEAK